MLLSCVAFRLIARLGVCHAAWSNLASLLNVLATHRSLILYVIIGVLGCRRKTLSSHSRTIRGSHVVLFMPMSTEFDLMVPVGIKLCWEAWSTPQQRVPSLHTP